jgi:cytochrome c556
MIRRVLAVAIVAAVGITAAVAQDVIAERRELMKNSGAQARTGAQMARGEVPFDLAKAQGIFDVYIAKAERLERLFPATSKTGGETKALPAIWDKPADWKAAIEKFGTDSKAAKASTKDLDSFKVAFAAAGKNCGACHEVFRRSQ